MAGQRLGWRIRCGRVAVVIAGVALAASGCGLQAAATGADVAGGSHASGAAAAAGGPTAPDRVVGPGGLPLAGKVIGVDPGHNGGNFTHPGEIDKKIWNGREWEDCNTTGTATDSGYTEALFNFRVASYLRADLVAAGAKVVMTRASDTGVGPCVNQRAAIINAAHANVGIAIHADGAAPGDHGFAILVPVADGPNDKVIGASAALARDIRSAMLAGTPMPVSNYDGVDAIQPRDDLAGLNLTEVPTVLVEVGNMRNATDARLETSAAFQQQVAEAFLAAIIKYLG